MDKFDLVKHAMNIARMMQSVADFAAEQPGPIPPELKSRKSEEFVNYGKYEEPTQLYDIGLDDVNMAKIVIELSQDRTEFKIWTPFDQDFVDAIKEKIPKRARRWDPDERCWRVDCYWFGNAQEIIPKYFYGLERHYTTRAYRMCEQIALDDEAEAKMHRPRKKQPKKSKKQTSENTKKKEKRKPRKKKKVEEEESPYDILNVNPTAPDEIVKAAHRVLARLNHSDLGGDENKMKKINEAFEQIKAERGWVKSP